MTSVKSPHNIIPMFWPDLLADNLHRALWVPPQPEIVCLSKGKEFV
jgi:hypothetical protein